MLNICWLRVKIEIGNCRQRLDVPQTLGPDSEDTEPACGCLGNRIIAFLPVLPGPWAKDTLDKSPILICKWVHSVAPHYLLEELLGLSEVEQMTVVYTNVGALPACWCADGNGAQTLFKAPDKIQPQGTQLGFTPSTCLLISLESLKTLACLVRRNSVPKDQRELHPITRVQAFKIVFIY